MYANRFFIRFFSKNSCNFRTVQLKNVKGKSVSSQKWLLRQLKDPYVEKAKIMNYRCRSAFKLIEIDDRYNILKPGQLVIDCGASPGSWTQVAVQRVNSDGAKKDKIGMVVSIDKQPILPIQGAVILGNKDFTTPETQEMIENILKGSKVDAVVSDMAPNAIGVAEADNENILKLCYSALRFAVLVSAVKASLLVKVWQCPDCKNLESDMLKFYDYVHIIKPQSSRSDSSEIFLLARSFKGLAPNSLVLPTNKI